MKKSLLFALASLSAAAVWAATPPMTYPKEWRTWQHVKSMVITDKSNGLYGFHHVFVQPSALSAYRQGKGYADGATLVVPFYEVKEAGGAVSQGPLMKVAVMKKEASATTTGGWQFAAFDAAGKRVELDAKTSCYECHAPRKDRDFVFSEWSE